MTKRTVIINDITYTIRATTSNGIDEAIDMLRRSVKQLEKQKKQKKQTDNDALQEE